MRRLAFALLPLCLCGALHAADATDAARKLAQDAVIVDTHIDAPELGVDDWRDLSVLTPDREFDYPRAREGGLDVAWMSIFTSHDADETGKGKSQVASMVVLVLVTAGAGLLARTVPALC